MSSLASLRIVSRDHDVYRWRVHARTGDLGGGDGAAGVGADDLGAFVRASESGLGCPDWPACHGRLLAGGHHTLIEEAHRWVATVLIVGVAGLALAVLHAHRGRERRLRGPLSRRSYCSWRRPCWGA